MRALAHPLRLTLLRLLTSDGPATAPQLAAKAGVSVASADYHLKQLAKYKFIEHTHATRQGKERPWRARVRGLRWNAGTNQSPEFEAASRLLREHLITH